jgi:hypothetical protein
MDRPCCTRGVDKTFYKSYLDNVKGRDYLEGLDIHEVISNES